MDTLSLVIGAVFAVAVIALIFWIAARWPAWKAAAAGWFTSKKAAALAAVKGDVAAAHAKLDELTTWKAAVEADVAAIKARLDKASIAA